MTSVIIKAAGSLVLTTADPPTLKRKKEKWRKTRKKGATQGHGRATDDAFEDADVFLKRYAASKAWQEIKPEYAG